MGQTAPPTTADAAVQAAPPVVPAPSPRGRRRTPRRGAAAWCADHPWRTLLAALLVLAGAVVLLGGGITTTKSAEQLVGDSAAAVKIADGADFGEKPMENVVVSTRSGGTLDAASVARLTGELTTAYTGVAGVAKVGKPVTSADGRTLLLPVALQTVPAKAGSTSGPEAADVAPMLGVTAKLAATHPDLRIGQAGGESMDHELGKQLDEDFQRAELFSLPVTLGVLLVAFGAVVAAGVPVLLGIGAVVTALGLTAWTSRSLVAVDANAQSMVLLIGLAVGVDYALFVVRRSREERAAGASVQDAVRTAGATAGRAVVISGVTVVVAMAGMLVAGGMFTSLAIGAILVVAVAVVASATVLPALLRILGDKIEALRLPFTKRRNARRGSVDSGWGRLAGRVAHRPLLWGVAAAAVLVAVALPAAGMRTSLFGPESMPKSFATVDAYDRLTTAFPQQGASLDLVVSAPASAKAQVEQALQAGWAAAPGTGVVTGGTPEVKTSTDGAVRVLSLPVSVSESDEALPGIVERVHDRVVPAVEAKLAGVPGAQVHVGGAAAASDLSTWMDARLPWVIGFVLVLTFVVMLVSFGSTWLAAATVGLNLLSVGAAYGVMTLVFQNTWAEGLLGFTSLGAIASWLPLLMFVILFGLSMDYHVFVVSRVREAFTAGATPREAVRLGVARSAGVVTSAAAVMVAVFAIFATLSGLEMKQLGVGLATAVLLDATIVRGILLPAVLALLGRRAHTGPRWVPTLHH
jgi:putative drug exporter of the RND superfamily